MPAPAPADNEFSHGAVSVFLPHVRNTKKPGGDLVSTGLASFQSIVADRA
jgi:hypothetical protein